MSRKPTHHDGRADHCTVHHSARIIRRHTRASSGAWSSRLAATARAHFGCFGKQTRPTMGEADVRCSAAAIQRFLITTLQSSGSWSRSLKRILPPFPRCNRVSIPATTQYPASGLFTVRTRPPFLCARSRHFYELRSIYAYRRFSRANKIRTPWTSRERACSQ